MCSEGGANLRSPIELSLLNSDNLSFLLYKSCALFSIIKRYLIFRFQYRKTLYCVLVLSYALIYTSKYPLLAIHGEVPFTYTKQSWYREHLTFEILSPIVRKH